MASDHGTPPHPVDVLHEEHRVILEVLDAIEAEAKRSEVAFEVRLDFWLRALDFLEHFADQAHHCKEEHAFFDELEKAGLAEDHGPLAGMRKEHEVARLGRTNMVATIASQDVPGLGEAVRSYAEQLRRHIETEERVLFPLALEILDDAAVARLREAFQKHARVQSDAQRERLRRVAADLAATAGQMSE